MDIPIPNERDEQQRQDHPELQRINKHIAMKKSILISAAAALTLQIAAQGKYTINGNLQKLRIRTANIWGVGNNAFIKK